ncbi:MAG: hypothetical protein C5B49_08580 [Bdellovibrio sp.]|nr:MAG: hypothetical protein C5B49_08580 [Bdellovibrio sp.]
MNIVKATEKYENWLSQFFKLWPQDLELKHAAMVESPFKFLRATFYRWAQVWCELCGDFDRTPKVLAVGDLHVENFGTWRDVDGRLIWGVNDFDEACKLPYAFDLIRLTVSALMAIRESHFKLPTEDAVEAILDGYLLGLEKRGSPFVLEEKHHWLRQIALSELRDPVHFWDKIRKLKPASPKEARKAKKILGDLLPEGASDLQISRRVAGLGSLGRPRLVAVAQWQGGLICREAKAMAPSAVLFAAGQKKKWRQQTQEIVELALRAPDPYYRMKGKWLVRRLSPHCSRIEIFHLPKKRDELSLLEAMGIETANIHLGKGPGQDIRRDLTAQRRRQIKSAVTLMREQLLADWLEWRQACKDKY